ncbi:hypothetical protein [Tsukamurella soli]|uniref:hypothetical protein n=1 Tax=Tsukamurella soli TaxID=644556 RepID=UPI003618C3F3
MTLEIDRGAWSAAARRVAALAVRVPPGVGLPDSDDRYGRAVAAVVATSDDVARALGAEAVDALAALAAHLEAVHAGLARADDDGAATVGRAEW